MKQRTLATLLVATILGTVLSACSGGSQEPTQTPDPVPQERTSLVVGIAQDLDNSLDPHKTISAGTRETMFNVFEGLVKPTPSGELACAVAQSYEIDETSTVYTFMLREGVKFHNGQAVTVEDVVYSLNRCATPEEGVLTPIDNIASVEATDEKTVVVTLKQPSNEFLAYLTVAIIPQGYKDQDTQPVGTGPFAFTSRQAQDGVVLTRFEDYWGEKAKMETIELNIFENMDAMVLSMQSGAVDMGMHMTTTQLAQLGDGFTTTEGTMNLVQALYLNNAVAPFDNELVRQAMSYAVDKQEVLDFTADGRGAPIGSSMYPSFSKYFVPELTDYYTRDVEKAKALLTEAGYPNGFKMTIAVPSNYVPHMDATMVLVEQLRAVGITATVNPVEWSTWLEQVYTNREYEATVVGVDASAMTARALLERFVSDAPDNFINYNNPDYDALFEKAQASGTDDEQVAIYKEMLTMLTETAANVYMQDLADLVGHRTDITGIQFYPIYALDLSQVEFVK